MISYVPGVKYFMKVSLWRYPEIKEKKMIKAKQ